MAERDLLVYGDTYQAIKLEVEKKGMFGRSLLSP